MVLTSGCMVWSVWRTSRVLCPAPLDSATRSRVVYLESIHQNRPVYNMHPRQRLRLSTLPNLYEFDRKPTVAATTTMEVSDQDIGLKPDAMAQEVAERYVRAAIAYRLKQAKKVEAAEKARRARIVIAAQDLQISVETAQGIVDELVRISNRPQRLLNCVSSRSQHAVAP